MLKNMSMRVIRLKQHVQLWTLDKQIQIRKYHKNNSINLSIREHLLTKLQSDRILKFYFVYTQC